MSKTAKDLVEEAKKEVPQMTCEEYEKLRDEGTKHILLDVREKEEYDAGHTENAMHISRGLVEFKIAEAIPDKEALIIVECAAGARGALCSERLEEMGYTNVRNLAGGYTDCPVDEEK